MRKTICIGLSLLMIATILPATAMAVTWIDSVDTVTSDSNGDGYPDTVSVTANVKGFEKSGLFEMPPSYVKVEVRLFGPGREVFPGSGDWDDMKSYTWANPGRDLTLPFRFTLTTSNMSGVGDHTVLIEESNDGSSGARTDIEERHVMLYKINMTDEFILTAEKANEVVAPGQQAVYAVGLVNKGPVGDTFSISVTTPSFGWTASTDRPSVFVTPYGSASFNVTVKAPDAYSGNMLFVTLVVSAEALTTLRTGNISLRATIGLADVNVSPENLGLSEPEAVAGLPVKLQAHLFNTGTVDANNVTVRFSIDGKPVGDTTVATIAAGGGHALAEKSWAPVLGAVNMSVALDPDNTIGEFDDGNNQATVTLTVVAPDLAIGPSDISITPASLQAGTAATVHAVVSNTGTANITGATVRLSVGNFTQDRTIGSLPKGNGAAAVDFNWTAVGGTWVLEVTVTPPNTPVTEMSVENNRANRTVRVDMLPVAAIKPSSTTAKTGKKVTFSASGSSDADGTVASYYFDFGDGTNSSWVTESNVSHSYAKSGTYAVKLVVKDNESAISKEVSTIVAISKPAAEGKSPGFGLLAAFVAFSAAFVALRRRKA